MHTHESYTVGIVCALAIEATAVVAMLDQKHHDVGPVPGDCNLYYYGKIGEHMVVVACLPAVSTGPTNAAIVASKMIRSFKLRHGLMVGIGGGAPRSNTDIRLGDVVVSQPHETHGGVVQFDFGKTEAGEVFRRTGVLNKPPRALLNAVQGLKIKPEGIHLDRYIRDMVSRLPMLREKGYFYQGQHNDELFEASYDHTTGVNCQDCDRTHLVQRTVRDSDQPKIHYGNIASGHKVINNGSIRDRIAEREAVICFETAAAGVMDIFPCLVIRGICDYADSHKNKRWQPYAAATAAAYAKELLLSIPVDDGGDTRPAMVPAGRFLIRSSYTLEALNRNRWPNEHLE